MIISVILIISSTEMKNFAIHATWNISKHFSRKIVGGQQDSFHYVPSLGVAEWFSQLFEKLIFEALKIFRSDMF